ncbi:uncharacterized protein EV420DRAFT_1151361 [Desarmillaria tabescens]|uniref:SET domain-containing protein n=1 Tax=Armillaria tabescens TaxID=1929756 RepID=A0AA39TYE4_ARMTA|nr:uncharacterized protein EV420DRAFT_1151361 [Desarmillaria tabescens]KAK0463035.1 hypothetical protein EV420DRAFT_1151361 [Desarmillaria tabescens]
MAHRFLNAAKANWRLSSTRKPTVINTNLKRQVDEMKNLFGTPSLLLSVSFIFIILYTETVNNLTREEYEELIRKFGVADDDVKALAPLPDENDPGIFENEPHPNDDVRTHVQVGDSQCLLTNYVKRRLEHIPGFPRPVKDTGDKAYRISSTLHRGLGMFAARRFNTGDLIADERPLMVYPLGPSTDLSSMSNGVRSNQSKYSQDLIGSIFERMSKESREAFMGLCKSRLHDDPLLGVIFANGFHLADDLKDETDNVKYLSPLAPNIESLRRLGRYASVHKDLSRVNHSCSPNASYKFHISTFSMQLRAARDIEAGEEIFTTCIDNLQPAAERARCLLPHGIECTCRACLDPTKSDPIRAAVKNRPVLFTPRDLKPPQAWIDPALQTLARIEEEELQASTEYRQTLRQLFNAYMYVKDEENALVYGKKLWAANLAAGKPLCEMFRDVELMKKSPQWTRPKWLWGVQKRHVIV